MYKVWSAVSLKWVKILCGMRNTECEIRWVRTSLVHDHFGTMGWTTSVQSNFGTRTTCRISLCYFGTRGWTISVRNEKALAIRMADRRNKSVAIRTVDWENIPYQIVTGICRNWLKSLQVVLLCMFQTNLLMGNCNWRTIGTRVQSWLLGGDKIKTTTKTIQKRRNLVVTLVNEPRTL